jgi:hypothetical protein
MRVKAKKVRVMSVDVVFQFSMIFFNIARHALELQNFAVFAAAWFCIF